MVYSDQAVVGQSGLWLLDMRNKVAVDYVAPRSEDVSSVRWAIFDVADNESLI
jgi:hypothetical protein